MHNLRARLPFSPIRLAVGIVGTLAVTYIGLIAVVMSYAALTIEYAQSVKDDGAVVATLESQYLARVASVENTDYLAAGYAKPADTVFVPTASVTAMR
jgi:acyl-coenzyme A synthetase/AMP-(fatty) acid ligase